MSRAVLVAGALAVTLVLGATAGLHYRASRPVTFTLRFHPFVGMEPLVASELRYANPGGEGRFEVRDFQFFLSNVRLAGDAGAYAEPGSYHLVRFDAGRSTYVVTLREVPRGDYDRIEFGIGVDPAANRSIEAVGDLDPNGRMAWTWDVGYKFVLFEGALERKGERTPLVYHVGFDENYRLISVPLDADVLDVPGATVDFRVDLLRMFAGDATVDMATLSAVKFDRADAALLARNYAGMISPMSPGQIDRSDHSRRP